MEQYQAIKKNELMPFAATWKYIEIIILIEVSQKEKDTVISLICGILKNDTDEFIYKAETHSQT